MFSIIVGVIFIAFTVLACLPKGICPFALEWGPYIINALKGTLPVISALVGIVAIMLGFTDIRDKREARREEEEALLAEQEEKNRTAEKEKKSEKK